MTESLKTCNVCKIPKQRADYSKRRASDDGLNFTCRDCSKERSASWKKAHPTAHAEWYRLNSEHKRAYWARWRAANADRAKASYQRWAKANPGRINALIAKRTAAKFRATPKWADLDAIRAVYEECARITRETGIRHEVDHIYPLQGKTVCGLHVACNLQILTKTENIRKHNKLPDHAAA